MQKKEHNIHVVTRDSERLNEILIDNFVGLQKAVTNLAGKFDDMANQMSKLLQLFEISARSFSEKLASTVPEIEKDREFLDKLNKLLDQNKTIAKGLSLMEEKLRDRVYGGHSSQLSDQSQPQQFQQTQQFSPRPRPQAMPGYTQSSMTVEEP